MQFGPVLIFRRLTETELQLAALLVREGPEPPPPVIVDGAEHAPKRLAEIAGHGIWRIDFALPRGGAGHYSHGGESHTVATDFDGDLNLAFVSCNGEEAGDLERDEEERNRMWRRLEAAQDRAPFHLMLHGGDQVYADEVTDDHPLSRDWPEVPAAEPDAAALDGLRAHLRERLLERYAATYSAPGFARVAARVPSLMIWDDHDICDGWGSLGERAEGSGVGRTLFAAAREAFLLYQHAATEDERDDLFLDPTGTSLGWRRDLPGLSIVAPDLRSERQRRRVIGPAGWAGFERACEDLRERVLLISSVPLLGPRLSVLEWLMGLTRRMERYEDDLRDQWQSRAHRGEWVQMLQKVLGLERAGHRVTAISGEIHLATRAELTTGAAPVHQLVASGISHRAPPGAYARVLGLLARFGEAPIPQHPIRIRPLPGQRRLYAAERNWLQVERRDGVWQARWELEDSGTTPWLPL
ncbi:alkaline phosphatase D family protein [Roseivivax sp. CAU 1761]